MLALVPVAPEDSLPPLAAVIMFLALCGTLVVILGPLIRAVVRRLESRGAGAELQADVESLRSRVDQLEQGQSRVAELEERLDFAERLLAQTRDPGRLQG